MVLTRRLSSTRHAAWVSGASDDTFLPKNRVEGGRSVEGWRRWESLVMLTGWRRGWMCGPPTGRQAGAAWSSVGLLAALASGASLRGATRNVCACVLSGKLKTFPSSLGG
ncbi:hypothetical protein Ae201684P_005072 [Aphanomyces euteiches]|uniref:Uncharacterized protein n=1 Tax=Aphanomyces euteiches TaxID=100861 RepID=A0A6G0X4L5_9STRA|nr:hypothetical protein Ae201684_008498 [Aphanomyces euteiches]KAH9085363.1 hypothetical protein Ae201684P_005072 [Aphanomyces euteiches]